jgi:tetratricopeptide (TPR) repeat protein
VLAAFPYRHGRVVVASLGQWFMPSPFFSPQQEARPQHWTNQLPRENLPVERGPQRELPLLANVIRWLTEPQPDDEPLQDRRKPFVEAHAASLRVQFNTAPRGTLNDALKKLVAEAPGGVWKEEALWTAGEASLRWTYLNRLALGYPAYSFPNAEGPPQPVPEYYQRLIAEFPQSPLRPLAQWRLAECARRKVIADRFKELKGVAFADQRASLPAYEKVDAPKGSYPWAWARLWIGSIHACNDRWKEAAAEFREVAETMPVSPEKSIALLNLGHVLENDSTRWDEAARYYNAAKVAPDNSWYVYWYNTWGPIAKLWSQGQAQSTHFLANAGLTKIRRAAEKK